MLVWELKDKQISHILNQENMYRHMVETKLDILFMWVPDLHLCLTTGQSPAGDSGGQGDQLINDQFMGKYYQSWVRNKPGDEQIV